MMRYVFAFCFVPASTHASKPTRTHQPSRSLQKALCCMSHPESWRFRCSVRLQYFAGWLALEERDRRAPPPPPCCPVPSRLVHPGTRQADG
ncbi:hypothetical protein BKA80DRAFT_260459 [Phyllosticta citrichinensis]